MTTPSCLLPAFIQDFAESQANQQILPFWSQQTLAQPCGLLSAINQTGQAIVGSAKGAIMNARLLWSFSFAYQQTDDSLHMLNAHRCFEGFIEHLIDAEHGGVFWSLDGSNQPLETNKHLLSHTYAVFALSQYYLGSRDPDALKIAHEIAAVIEQRFEREDGTFASQFAQDWSVISDESGVIGTCNQLHTLEALTVLYMADPSSALKNRLITLIDQFLVHIYPASEHLCLSFDRNWQPVGQQRSYGHNFEAPWLVALACEAIDDPIRLKLANIELKRLVKLTLGEGRHSSGHVLNGCDANGVADESLSWWPQVEASNALLWLADNCNNDIYTDELTRIWQLIEDHWVDHDHGEWHPDLDFDLQPVGTQNKADIWRSAYHTTRACFLLAHGKSALNVNTNTITSTNDTPAGRSAEMAVGINY